YLAATSVVAEPANGSSIPSPGKAFKFTSHSIQLIGLVVKCFCFPRGLPKSFRLVRVQSGLMCFTFPGLRARVAISCRGARVVGLFATPELYPNTRRSRI